MARGKARKPSRKIPPKDPEIELSDEHDEPPESFEPLPRIDRRHSPRIAYQITAWLAPADDTGAIRRPVIRTRDLNLSGLGFRARCDVSALGEAILRLPGTTGRSIAVSCRIRRSLEMGNGWFDGLLEFLQPQPDLAQRHAKLCVDPGQKPARNFRGRK